MKKIRKRVIVSLCALSLVVLCIRFFGAEILTSTAASQMSKGKYGSAAKSADAALFLEPENREARLVYIKALTNLPPSVSVQKAIFDFTQSKHFDEADNIAEAKVLEWRNFALKKTGKNYILHAPMDTLVMHWDKNSFPLTVSFVRETKVPEYYEMRARAAFETWEKESHGFFKFRFSDNNADIVVKFVPLGLSGKGERGYLGNPAFTVPDIKKNKLEKMTIYMHNTNRYNRYYPGEAVYTFILHEIAHTLGVMGHSPDPNDLMYMSNIASVVVGVETQIQKADLNTLYLLYSLVPDITNTDNYDTKGQIYAPIVLGSKQDIIARKIDEAREYIKNAPFQVSGYIDLAVLYASAKKYDEAEKALNTGLNVSKNQQEKYLIYYNFAILQMEKNAPHSALEYAKQAQSINNNPEIQALIEEIKKS